MAYNKNGPKHQGRKGQYVGTRWYDDIVVIPDDERVLPDTVPHDVVATHPHECRCQPCQGYRREHQDLLWHLKWRHQNPGKRLR